LPRTRALHAERPPPPARLRSGQTVRGCELAGTLEQRGCSSRLEQQANRCRPAHAAAGRQPQKQQQQQEQQQGQQQDRQQPQEPQHRRTVQVLHAAAQPGVQLSEVLIVCLGQAGMKVEQDQN
jgi:FtsZ-interacting cell division protein ZipA